MQLGMIGLGRIGANIVRRLQRAGHECVVFDRNPVSVNQLAGEGATGAASLDDFVEKLSRPRAAGPNTICQVLWCTRVVRNPSPSIVPVT